MTSHKNLQLASWLMAASIALLLLFQAYWLRKTYRSEYSSLRRELGLLLRETTVRRQMQSMMADSNWRMNFRYDTNGRDTRNITLHNGAKPGNGSEVQWQLKVTANDSGNKARTPQVVMATNERRREPPEEIQAALVVTTAFFSEKTDIKLLDSLYRKTLNDNGITLAYEMHKLSKQRQDSLMAADSVRVGFGPRRNMPFPGMDMLEARFDNPFVTLLYQMRWPLVFSVFMLAITIAAFLFLFRSLKAQQRLALLKSDFISNITHELKTPIATVGVAIEALKNFNAMSDPERTREYLDISGKELQRLGLLVDKVLRLSMFEQEKMDIKKEPLDLKELVQEVLQTMKLQLDKAGAITTVSQTDAPCTVMADKLHLQSVLYNLIDNALKYSSGTPHMLISLQHQGNNTLRLSVQDNGIGIPSEYRHRVFDKFFRVPHGDTHNIKGYGLGLSYVSEVVKRHQGQIFVNAVQPKGSEFVVTLPLQNSPT